MDHILESLQTLFRQNGVAVFGIGESRLLESEPEGQRQRNVYLHQVSFRVSKMPMNRF